MGTRNTNTGSRTSTTPTRKQLVAVPTKATRERTPETASEEHKRVSLPDGTTLTFTDHSVRLYDVDPDTDDREKSEYRELTNAELAELLDTIYQSENAE